MYSRVHMECELKMACSNFQTLRASPELPGLFKRRLAQNPSWE